VRLETDVAVFPSSLETRAKCPTLSAVSFESVPSSRTRAEDGTANVRVTPSRDCKVIDDSLTAVILPRAPKPISGGRL
jgi:hypothetical protein